MKKSYLFFSILFNLLFIISFINEVSARQLTFYHTEKYSDTIEYFINHDNPLGKKGNRIATENFEYEENFKMNHLLTTPNDFTALVKSFTDIDYTTNLTYQSKGLLLTRNSSIENAYFNRSFNNQINSWGLSYANIIRPNRTTFERIFFYYENLSYVGITLRFDLKRAYISINGSTIQTLIDFLPTQYSYEYIKFSFTPMFITIDFQPQLSYVAYNQTGTKIGQNLTTLTNLKSFGYSNIRKVETSWFLPSLGNSVFIIAEDFNSINERMNMNVNAIDNDEYYTINDFYLVEKPFYSNVITSDNSWHYATTLYKGKYLRYLTNASTNSAITIPLSDLIEGMSTSNMIKSELQLDVINNLDTAIYQIDFNHTRFRLGVLRFNSELRFNILNNLTVIDSFRLSNYNQSFIDKRVIVYSQFKNRQLTVNILVNQTIHKYSIFVNDVFSDISTDIFRFVNFEYSANINTITQFSNLTILTSKTDTLTFIDKVSVLYYYSYFQNIINIPIPDVEQLISINSENYGLIGSTIVGMNFIFNRSAENGDFHLSHDNSYVIGVFNSINRRLEANFSYNFLEGLNFGQLFLNVEFKTSTELRIYLYYEIDVTRLLIFSNQIPTNNLILTLSLNIMLPFLILGTIIIGFKSNSDSKYMAFIGMYIALFTLYIMEYMSLIFFILSALILSFSLYIIIKRERSDL